MEYKIPVTYRENIVYALVDEEDYEKCIELKWHLANGYAVNREKVISIFLLNNKYYNLQKK